MKKAIFLDRDGVINELVNINGISRSPHNLNELFFSDNLLESLEIFKLLKFELIIITNQPDITRGKFSEHALQLIHNNISSFTGITNIYFCPHIAIDDCFCRKPKPGLILQAAKDLNININLSYLIGDNYSDILAGRSANLKECFLIQKPYNNWKSYKDVSSFKSLKSAALHIFSRMNLE